MKNLIALALAVMMMGITNVHSQKSTDLEGVWVMTYQKWETMDTTVEISTFDNPAYKIFADEYFSWSKLDIDDDFRGHFGKYTYNGKKYVEHIDFSVYKNLHGTSVEFKSKMKDGVWTIEGRLESDEGYTHLVENWERVE